MTSVEYDPLEGSDKYRAIKELGRGGMGEVFLAEHTALGTKVVIKLLHAELSDKNTLVDRMRLEAQACARISHPNIVRVTDFERSPTGRPYFVMEYLPGRSLRDEVDARGGWLPVAEALDLVQQALAGLAAAHGAGLVHRDIKLDNLFICDANPQSGGKRLLKILDFGVAKVLDGASDAPAPLMVPTGTGVVVGTPRFFAPEQARGKPLDHRADIYAMGLVLYSVLAGRGPFDEAKNITEMAKAHVFKAPDPPSRFAKQPIPDRLDAIVLRAIAKLPEQRFQSATEFAAMLERVVEPAARAQAAGTQASSSQASSSQASGGQPGLPLAKTAYMPPEENPAPRPDPRQATSAPSMGHAAAHASHPSYSQPSPAPSVTPSSPSPPTRDMTGIARMAYGATPNPYAANPLAPNPLAPNPLAPNPLAPNPLAPNPLAPNPLAPGQLPGAPSTAPLPDALPQPGQPGAREPTWTPHQPALPAGPPVGPMMHPSLSPALPPQPMQPLAHGPKRYSALIAAAIVLFAGLIGAAVAAVAMRYL